MIHSQHGEMPLRDKMMKKMAAPPRPSGPVMGPGKRAPKKPEMLGSASLSELKRQSGFGGILHGKRQPYRRRETA